MSIDYRKFDFNKYKPKKLERLAKSVTVDDYNGQPDTDKVQALLDKLRNGLGLRNSEVKVLCYFVHLIKEEGLLDSFSSACDSCFNKQARFYYHVKGLLHSYYNDFTDPELFRLLQLAIARNSVWKEPLASIKDPILKSQNYANFFKTLYEYFGSFKSFAEIQHGKDQILMKENDRIFINLLLRLLEEWIIVMTSQDDFGTVKDLINLFKDYNTLKPAFEKFLISQKFRVDFDKLPRYLEDMFNVIGETLGDPYGQNRTRWQGLTEEAKKVFTLWKTQKKIGIFFGEIAGDPIRLNFWKKYSHYFYRVEYFEKYDGAILMETDRHLFIEFSKIGALHMYEVKNLSMRDVERNPKGYSRTKMVSWELKNKNIATYYKSHTHGWQDIFQRDFEYFGYKMR